jgi:uncharacterized protein with HEPN domain
MNADDVERLRHMLDAAREAMGFVEGRVAEDLTRDRLLLLGLVKEIEIIGEAAGIIWSTLTTSLPPLVSELERVLARIVPGEADSE